MPLLLFSFSLPFPHSTYSHLFTSLTVPTTPTILTILNSLTIFTNINIFGVWTFLIIPTVILIFKIVIIPTSLTFLDIHGDSAICIISFVCASHAVCLVNFLRTFSPPFVLRTPPSQLPLVAVSVSSSMCVLAAQWWLFVSFGLAYPSH